MNLRRVWCRGNITRLHGKIGGSILFAIVSGFVFLSCDQGARAATAISSNPGLPASAVAEDSSHSGAGSGGAVFERTGSYRVTFHLAILSTLPVNASVVCKVGVTPLAAGGTGGMVAGLPVESASSMAVFSGNSATCVVRIPFAWTLPGGSDGVTLSYEVDAYGGAVGMSVPVRSSVQPAMREPMPPSGAERGIDLPLAF